MPSAWRIAESSRLSRLSGKSIRIWATDRPVVPPWPTVIAAISSATPAKVAAVTARTRDRSRSRIFSELMRARAVSVGELAVDLAPGHVLVEP